MVRSILTYIHFWLPPPMRSPTSTRGLPSIGKGQPPFYSFTPFDGLRRQPLQTFLSSLERSKLGRKEGGELLAFTTLLSSKNHRVRLDFWCFWLPFHAGKGEIYIGPKLVWIWSSKVSFPGFLGSWRYYLLTGVAQPPSSSKTEPLSGATAW